MSLLIRKFFLNFPFFSQLPAPCFYNQQQYNKNKQQWVVSLQNYLTVGVKKKNVF